MSEVIPFEHEEFGSIHIFQDEFGPGEPGFIVQEICAPHRLDLPNPSQALRAANVPDACMKKVNTIILNDGNRGNPWKLAVNEGGLNLLIVSSRKPGAVRFKQWVCLEVLPAIRKQGYYSATGLVPTMPIEPIWLPPYIRYDGSPEEVVDKVISLDLAVTVAYGVFLGLVDYHYQYKFGFGRLAGRMQEYRRTGRPRLICAYPGDRVDEKELLNELEPWRSPEHEELFMDIPEEVIRRIKEREEERNNGFSTSVRHKLGWRQGQRTYRVLKMDDLPLWRLADSSRAPELPAIASGE